MAAYLVSSDENTYTVSRDGALSTIPKNMLTPDLAMQIESLPTMPGLGAAPMPSSETPPLTTMAPNQYYQPEFSPVAAAAQPIVPPQEDQAAPSPSYQQAGPVGPAGRMLQTGVEAVRGFLSPAAAPAIKQEALPEENIGPGAALGLVGAAQTPGVYGQGKESFGVSGTYMPYQKELQGAFGGQVGGIKAEAKAKGELATKKAEAFVRIEAQQQADMQAEQSAASEQRKKSDEFVGQIKSANDEIAKAGQIDPDRMWKNKGSAARILGAISIGLGAFGAKDTGGRNMALDIIENQIQRDIDSQKADMSARREGMEGLKWVYAQHRQNGLDDASAREASRAMYYKMAETQIQRLSFEMEDPILKAQAQRLAGEVRERQYSAEQKASFEMMKAQGIDPALLERSVYELKDLRSGGDFFARSKEEGTALSKGMGKFREIELSLNELIGLREKYGTEYLGSMFGGKIADRMRKLEQDILTSYKDIAGTGVLTPSEIEYLQTVIPAKTWGAGFKSDQIKNFMNIQRNKVNANLRAYGATMFDASQAKTATPVAPTASN